MKIFCYGTLKKGYMRNRNLSNQKFLGEVKTLPKYKLYRLDSFPGLVHADDGLAIKGELYDVDEECLKTLDYIEGHPDLFKREKIEIENHPEETVAYFWQGEPGQDAGDCWE
jgi:gamma-glutamylcyclotransferase (GGCT)/AIG2-like uncharacterized protein YtfP